MFELLFLLAFTLHNIEEGLWLPRWSSHAGRYHKPVSNREFHFALVVITAIAYLIAFLALALGPGVPIFKQIFAGFILMMAINAIFPHLIATLVLRRYAPGTLTGLLLILPIGSFLVYRYLLDGMPVKNLLLSFILVSSVTLALLRPLFKIGSRIIDEY